MSTIAESLAKAIASFDKIAGEVIAKGPITRNRVMERLMDDRANTGRDPTNIIAALMRSLQDADVGPVERAYYDMVIEELDAAQSNIIERQLAILNA